jgi:hypothetical protein
MYTDVVIKPSRQISNIDVKSRIYTNSQSLSRFLLHRIFSCRCPTSS